MTAPKAPTLVTAALSKVMEELPAIGKTREQGSSVQYAFRGIEAITAEAQTLFAKYGVVFAPRVLSHEIRDITVNQKPWTDTILTVEYDVYGPSHSIETPDKIVVGPLVAIGRDNSDKGANKAMTQAFKYALLQVLCISDRNDDGDAQTHETDARNVSESGHARSADKIAEAAHKAKVEELKTLAKEKGATSWDDMFATINPILKRPDDARFDGLTIDQINTAISHLNEKEMASA